jgi:hypothetical protein
MIAWLSLLPAAVAELDSLGIRLSREILSLVLFVRSERWMKFASRGAVEAYYDFSECRLWFLGAHDSGASRRIAAGLVRVRFYEDSRELFERLW